MPLKKAGTIIQTVVIVILAILLAATLVMKLIFHVELKAVLTGSMEPELPVGSLLVIVPADYEDIQIGDDITFVRDETLTLVTHRVVEKDAEKQTLTTQGIANNTLDAPTSYDNVVGKVRASIPLIGYVGLWLSTPTSVIIVVTAIISLIIVSLLIRYVFFPFPGENDEAKEEETQKENKEPE